jgi:hypothetical protein
MTLSMESTVISPAASIRIRQTGGKTRSALIRKFDHVGRRTARSDIAERYAPEFLALRG